MRIYLDVCCLNRPFDDQKKGRIRLEAEAVLLILGEIELRKWEWVGSEVLTFEIDQIPDTERRTRVQALASHAHVWIQSEQAELDRAEALVELGFGAMDALHLACAESADIDVFLTTDDSLLRLASRFSGQLKVRVHNPLPWVREVLEQ